MVQLAANGLFESTFADKSPERLGTAWLAVKTGVAKGDIDPLSYKLLDAVDGDADIPQATQRLEHLEMFVLLGDPALKLPVLPADLELKTDDAAAPGTTLTLRGTAPARLTGARVRVTVERPVSSAPDDLESSPKDAGPARDETLMRNHERANRFVVAAAETTVRDGRFTIKLDLPAKLPWSRLTIRAYAATDAEEGMGVLPLDVPEPK
jgi:hypothetical protein